MILDALVLNIAFFCPFVGSVLLVYEARDGNTLTNLQAIGCLLLALPFVVLAGLLLALVRKAANSQARAREEQS